MRLPSEIRDKYMIYLEIGNSWLPDTPKEVIRLSMGFNKYSMDYLGIDPEKQNFLSLKTPLKIVDDTEERTVRVALPCVDGKTFLYWLFPRFGVKIVNGKITEVTESVRHDYLRKNSGYKEISWKCFDDSALDIQL